MHRKALTICSVMAIASGCRTTDTQESTEHTPAGPKITQANLVDETAKAVCEVAMACQDTWGTVAHSTTECVDMFRTMFAVESVFGVFADPTRYTLDAQKAQQCIDSIRQSACDELFEADMAACDEMGEGILDEGDCCARLGGCKPGLYCDHTGDGATCKVFVQDGDNCEDAMCAPGFHCVQDGADFTCAASAGENQFCNSQGACQEGLYCDLLENVCKARLGVGEECLFSSECQPHLYCGDADKCVAHSEPAKELGELCDHHDECSNNGIFTAMCVENSNGDAVCTRAPLAGEECGGDLLCPWFLGLACVDGTCERWPGVGEACDTACYPLFDVYCEKDSQDLDAPGECKLRVQSGEACDSETADVSFFLDACDVHSECIDDSCVSYESLWCPAPE